MNNSKLILTLEENSSEVNAKFISASNEIIYKTIPDHLIANFFVDKQEVKLGPFHSFGISYYTRNLNKEILLFTYPASLLTYNYHNKRTGAAVEAIDNVPIPITLFVFVKAGSSTYTYCICLKHYALTQSTEIYHWPYGNTYNDGKICWGSTEHVLNGIESAIGIINNFLSSTFNDDLYQKPVIAEYQNYGQKELAQTLCGKIFPNNALNSIGNLRVWLRNNNIDGVI